MNSTKVWTIGHSTRTIEDFIALLMESQIGILVDVRSYPSSRRLPHFNQNELAVSLESRGISYRHLKSLGGRRRPSPKSRNLAWNNPSFRAYADHMETAEFESGVKDLLELAREERSAIMCAEALWWQCHRSLISDFLKSKGVEVMHITGKGKVEAHHYTSPARILEGRLSYAGLFTEHE